MMINCDICRGKKKVIGLGNMPKDCDTCHGTGWLDLPDNDLKVTLKDVMENPAKEKRKKKKTENAPPC